MNDTDNTDNNEIDENAAAALAAGNLVARFYTRLGSGSSLCLADGSRVHYAKSCGFFRTGTPTTQLGCRRAYADLLSPMQASAWLND